ncbi:hypothetical protein DL98DRAFT_512716 [Cadophora sp. DSE1049]|nr:hypothetical protein DL98DRAFT_512716 [Cadophora sp. DSE1049]
MPTTSTPSPSPSPNPNPIILTTLNLCFILYLFLFITIITLYFTGCIVTETSITSSIQPVQKAAKCDTEERALLAEKGESTTRMDGRRIVETHWRTTKVRVWGREAILWSFGGKKPRVERRMGMGEGESEKGER